jgi:ABC-type antimicrobial peptide transport system permease subunit
VFGITATDVRVYAAVAVVLFGLGVAAGLVPAFRAARVDPLAALRSE